MQSVNKSELNTLIKNPWTSDGQEFSERIWGRGENLTTSLRDNLIRDIARGSNPKESSRNIQRLFDVSKASASRLVFTETAAVNAKATQDSYEKLGVKQYQILATLDLKTSDICRSMDSKIFDYKDYRIGITAPPFNPNCRSDTVPYFGDEFEKEIDQGIGRMARDPESGISGRVEDLSYKEWYNIYVKDNPEAVFNEKAWKNRHGDKEQFYRYKNILGNKAPRSFGEFQELKYNYKDSWKALKLEYEDEKLKIAIKTQYNLKINDGRQGKHILGHNNYESGKSYLKKGIDPQELVDKYAGTGKIRRSSKTHKWIGKQFFEHNKTVGYVLVDGNWVETNYFSIEYSKKYGTHIVPRIKGDKNDK